MDEEKYIGIVEDPRSQEEKEQDWQIQELIASVGPVVWREKQKPASEQFTFKDTTWRKFPTRDQDGSGTCVAQTAAKMLGIDNFLEEGKFVELSAVSIYHYRINKTWGNGEGMVGSDALELMKDKGATLEVLAPSQRMSEAQVNSYSPLVSDVQTALVFRAGGYLQLPTKDIDYLAQRISTGKGIMLWFEATMEEWNQDVPFLTNRLPRTVRHSVTGVDFILHKGKKAIVIDDSWGKFFGLDGQRIITEEFLKERCFFAAESAALRNDWRDHLDVTPPPVQKPKHTFLKNLEFSPVFKVEEDVKKLQEILRYEGFFPTHLDGQELGFTGYYGAVTAKAVLAFQEKHKVASPMELASLAGKKVGPKTREVLNDLYS